jgi:hypothetical protein
MRGLSSAKLSLLIYPSYPYLLSVVSHPSVSVSSASSLFVSVSSTSSLSVSVSSCFDDQSVSDQSDIDDQVSGPSDIDHQSDINMSQTLICLRHPSVSDPSDIDLRHSSIILQIPFLSQLTYKSPFDLSSLAIHSWQHSHLCSIYTRLIWLEIPHPVSSVLSQNYSYSLNTLSCVHLKDYLHQ